MPLMDYIAASTIVLFCHLAMIAYVDFRRLAIPNVLNLSLAICGLVVSVILLHNTLIDILLASGLTILIFLLISEVYHISRARTGIGMGDVKFLGAASIWVGLIGIPWVVLMASISGLIFALVLSVRGLAITSESRIAFGPHLSLGLLITWLLRDMIVVHV